MHQIRSARDWIRHNSEILFFVGGFLFDALTLVRIDSALDLLIQAAYLGIIAWLMILQTRQHLGVWHPSPRMAKFWKYENEALHFCYGGLLSAYVVFYFKSSTTSRSGVFLLLVIILMFANEMPQVRRAGSYMRLGLYTFCLVSFLNYLFPVLIGRMGIWVFALAVLVSAVLSAHLVRYLARLGPTPEKDRWRLGWAPTVVLVLISAFYLLKWIPPVPLSMQYVGIFHDVRREGDHFQLVYEKPSWYVFWRKEDRVFKARPGDRLVCFTRVFAPRRFSHAVYVRWKQKNPLTSQYQTTDRIPLPISGGRGEGYRGVAQKANFTPGDWSVVIEVEDGRPLGEKTFEVKADDSVGERRWKERRM